MVTDCLVNTTLVFGHKRMKNYLNLGRKFGYPDCCISEFIYCIASRTIHRRETRKLAGTGYIPCYECNSKYTEQELVDNINKNRDKTLTIFHSKI